MSQVSSRLPIRTVFCSALVVAAALALAACGSESDQTLTFELEGKGKSAKFTVPEGTESGRAEITFENNSAAASDMQLIRVEGDHSPKEVVEGLGKAMEGQPFPEWFFAGGGTATIRPGKSATVTQVLEPGTYYSFSTAGSPPDPESVTSVEVSGDESDEELEADTTVTASEYQFEAEGLKAGENEIDFRNVGAQPHHLLISKLIGDATAEDVKKAIKSGSKPPIEQKGGLATAVVEGGESQLVDLDLKPGRYAFYCFITDRQGGPPHAVKGMVDEFEIE